jgi:hypothetical protein
MSAISGHLLWHADTHRLGHLGFLHDAIATVPTLLDSKTEAFARVGFVGRLGLAYPIASALGHAVARTIGLTFLEDAPINDDRETEGYHQIIGEWEPVFGAFTAWMVVKHPTLFHKDVLHPTLIKERGYLADLPESMMMESLRLTLFTQEALPRSPAAPDLPQQPQPLSGTTLPIELVV